MHRRLPHANHCDECANRRLCHGRRDTVIRARVLKSGVHISIPRTHYTISDPGPPQNLGFVFPWLQILAMPCALCVALTECSALLRFQFISKMSTYLRLWILWAFALAFGCNTLSHIATCLILLTFPTFTSMSASQQGGPDHPIYSSTSWKYGGSRPADDSSRSGGQGTGSLSWQLPAQHPSASPRVLSAHNVGQHEGLSHHEQ